MGLYAGGAAVPGNIVEEAEEWANKMDICNLKNFNFCAQRILND
jgi:hypothetical protein